MSEIEVDERTGMVSVNIADHGRDGDCEADRLTPSQIRTLAEELLFAAAVADPIYARERMRCAKGHEWGECYNAVDATGNVTVRHCRREGCHGREVQPGWMHFAGRLHHDPMTGRPIACFGPGCEPCADVKFGAAIRTLLADAMAAMDKAVDAPNDAT